MVLEHKEHSTKPMDENRAQIEFMEKPKSQQNPQEWI
jgi:hypothetical protein